MSYQLTTIRDYLTRAMEARAKELYMRWKREVEKELTEEGEDD